MKHILLRDHDGDFQRLLGLDVQKSIELIQNIMQNSQPIDEDVKIKGGRKEITLIYKIDENSCLVVGIGDNGFITTAFPTSR